MRRFPASQVTIEFHHYLGRLSPERAAEARAVAEARGWDFSRMTREQAAEFLGILQGAEHQWGLEEVHALIGSEGMRSYYGYGTERPFGFETAEAFQVFRSDVLRSLETSGLPVSSGEARVILSGSAMSGYSSKGGQFRWNDTTDALGNTRAASDYDIKVIVSHEEFARWVERSLAAQPTERLRKALRKYIGNMDGLRWAEVPPSFREALRPLMERYPRIQQVTIALEGGYWHIQDPMADALHLDLTEEPRTLEGRATTSPPSPVSISAPAVVRTGWEEVLTDRINDQAVYEALSRVDRALAEYYRREISTAAVPVETMSDLLTRIAMINPQALEGTLQAASVEGRPLSQMRERAIFELVSRSAEARGSWRLEDITSRPRMAVSFETDIRRVKRDGVERREEARPARESEERKARKRRGRAEVRPVP